MKLCLTTTLLTGQVTPYTRPDTFSAVHKLPRRGKLHVDGEGIVGDEHGDPRVHGGADKAIHHYPYDHYRYWLSVYGEHPLLETPGAFGENISSVGLTEADVCLGDIISCGSTLLQITQTRQPCWKMNDRLGDATTARHMQDSGRVGWYYRVLQAGMIEAGDEMTLVDRLHPEWSLHKVLQLLYHDTLNVEALTTLQRLSLPPSWQKLIRNRIELGEVESWGKRLDGPPLDGPLQAATGDV